MAVRWLLLQVLLHNLLNDTLFLTPFLYFQALVLLPAAIQSLYQSSRSISISTAAAHSFRCAMSMVPVIGCSFAGWRRIQAMAMVVGLTWYFSAIRARTLFCSPSF